jgi:hypothetical protein
VADVPKARKNQCNREWRTAHIQQFRVQLRRLLAIDIVPRNGVCSPRARIGYGKCSTPSYGALVWKGRIDVDIMG